MLLIAGWATTALSTQRQRQRQQNAWQWWHQRQTCQAHHNAESIRNDLLQQTFAFRRYLEADQHDEAATATNSLDSTQTQQWLQKIQTFHQSLEGLSNELSPPFVSDSFPLALQFAIKAWQQQQPTLQANSLQLTLPAQWPDSSPQINQNVLSITTELLSVLSLRSHPHLLQIELTNTPDNVLIVKFHNDPAQTMPKISKLIEIQYLKEIFHGLSAGQLDISQDDNIVIGKLCWPSTASS